MSINPISGTFRDLTFLSPSGDEFQLTWDGHIYCEDRNCTSPAGSVWCPHLEDLVIKGWDGIPIFKMPLSIGEFDLMIPIFPTTDQWAKVHLVDPDAAQDEHTRWTVYWDECPTVVRPENAYPSSVYVTTLTSGEGRNVIRNTLIEYMRADLKRKTVCEAAHHGLAAQRDWDVRSQSPEHVVQAWSVYMTGQCLECRKVDPFAGDLIPDREGGGW